MLYALLIVFAQRMGNSFYIRATALHETAAVAGFRWVPQPLWRRAPRRLLREIGSRFCLDLGGDHRSAIFVAGSGRSGTSWLAELINHRNEYHYVFEPFHPPEGDTPNPFLPGVPACRHFGHYRYLRPEATDLRFLQPAAAVLAGRERSRWSERFNKRLIATRRIIKDIKANLILKWLSVNFPGMPIIFILRHPCAVVASRKSLTWDVHWDLVTSQLLRQPELLDDFMRPFLSLFQRAETYVEKQVLLWCLDNYVPLKQFTPDQIHVVFYENLIAHPQEEIPRLFAFLTKPLDDSIYAAMRTPSLLSDWSSPVLHGASRTNAWRTRLSASDFGRAMRILRVFGLDAIYSDDPMPRVAGLEEFMSTALVGAYG
jgi:Sulfotransferase family